MVSLFVSRNGCFYFLTSWDSRSSVRVTCFFNICLMRALIVVPAEVSRILQAHSQDAYHDHLLRLLPDRCGEINLYMSRLTTLKVWTWVWSPIDWAEVKKNSAWVLQPLWRYTFASDESIGDHNIPWSWPESRSHLQAALLPPSSVTQANLKVSAKTCAKTPPMEQKNESLSILLLTSMRPALPGTVGTPAVFIVSLAVALSPITRMLSD